jgi:hypothetical protein
MLASLPRGCRLVSPGVLSEQNGRQQPGRPSEYLARVGLLDRIALGGADRRALKMAAEHLTAD